MQRRREVRVPRWRDRGERERVLIGWGPVRPVLLQRDGGRGGEEVAQQRKGGGVSQEGGGT